KLRKFFKMDVPIIRKNISIARDFIRKYGLVYGVSEVQKVVVDAVPAEKKQKEILSTIFADSWLALLKQSCEKKNPSSCYFYGYGLELQGKKPAAYEQYYAKACHGNTAFACYNFAIMLLENCSKGVKIPLEKAVKACELGYAQSCFTVGMIYKKGKCSGDIDRKKALVYFKKACDAGYYGGCALAGAIFEDDKRVDDAMKYYKKACDLGYQKGCEAYNNGGATQ
ncbi:sel1 repeat family protein, partial [bacterium]|nr:sel1 repeat family protein [bacterium]